MSDDIPRDDEESLHDDAVTPEHGDTEKLGREDAGTRASQRSAASQSSTRGCGDAGTAGDVDAETRVHVNAENVGDVDAGTRASQRSAASQSSTPGRGDAGNANAGTGRRGDAEEMEEEAFLASEEGLAGSAEASALVAGEPQAAPAVEQTAVEESSVNEPPPPAVDRRKSPRGPRPSLEEEREPVFHDEGGYRMRMEPAALAKLRELPGAKGKTDRELGEEFFKGQSARLVASMAGDVETPAEVRVVVDPYSRQAFLAVGRTIRGIVSF